MASAPNARSRAPSALTFSERSLAMQRSSNKIGTLAAALAKAQAEIVDPGDVAHRQPVEFPFPREGQRTFRYAPLSTGRPRRHCRRTFHGRRRAALRLRGRRC